MFRVLVLMVLAIFVAGCATTNTISYELTRSLDEPEKSIPPKNAVVFIDGTANDQTSRTNISKLFRLVALRDDPQTDIFYTEGVGTDGRVLGSVFGLGHSNDVRDAYHFLTRIGVSSKTKLFLFGYSRGAYSIRALNGLIATAGVADTSKLSKRDSEKFVHELYSAYKGQYASPKNEESTLKNPVRLGLIKQVFLKWKPLGVKKRPIHRVELMGLWDTIEALGVPDYKEDVGEVNKRYVDTVCNIQRALHAVAIDDNRSRIYTPILMTGEHLVSGCDEAMKDLDETVHEVWFAGAHADVGGGYKEGLLSGVSMNWMIKEIQGYTQAKFEAAGYLLPKGAAVVEEPFDVIHNAEGGNLVYRIAFARLTRNLKSYIDDSGYNEGRIKVHQSALDRLNSENLKKISSFLERRQQTELRDKGTKPEKSRRFLKENPKDTNLYMSFHDCFKKVKGSYFLKSELRGSKSKLDPNCIEPVKNKK